MSKFTGLIICVVAVILSSNYVTKAENLRVYLKPALEACKLELHVTDDDINRAAETGDPNIIPPCYNGCVFKKSGFINDRGEYDVVSGMAYLRKVVKDEGQYNLLKEVATECTKNDEVSDGEAGCERGGRLSACFLQNKALVSV